MSLSSAKLESELLKILDENNASFLGWPADVSTAATNWKNAYHAYAQDAVDISNDTLLTSNPVGFESALSTGLASSITASQAATSFETAFTSYWLGATFNILNLPLGGIGGTGVFSAEITSVVTVVTANVLKNLLEVEFGNLSSDAATKAAALANAFHTATTTAVIVLITGSDTSTPPVPITNTNTIS